jgi:hypothetical protein
MAEEFRIKERAGQGGAVEGHEGPLPSGRKIVQLRRGQFLAGAALPDDQDGPVDARHVRELFLEEQKSFRLADGFHEAARWCGFHNQIIRFSTK